MKTRVYLYPDPTIADQINPYLSDLASALEADFELVRAWKPRWGVASLWLNIFRTDIYYFNWVEDLPSRRFGIFQTPLFMLFFTVARLLGKRHVWMIHNRGSHSPRRLQASLSRLLFRRSDILLSHCRQAFSWFESMYGKPKGRMYFRHHPVQAHGIPREHHAHVRDILIWGTIQKYKGVLDFLQELERQGALERYDILIAGKIPDPAHTRELMRYSSERVRIEPRIVSFDELAEFVAGSRITLFTYQADTVFSSGALMDTLALGGRVVGPDAGSFRDLREEGIIDTFTDLPGLVEALPNILETAKDSRIRTDEFNSENSWNNFSRWISEVVK